MTKNTCVCIMALCLSLSAFAAAEANWLYTPEEAFVEAQQSGKVIFVDVFTTWCSWCKRLDSETFAHSSFQEIAPKFVLLKVDGDKYPAFRQKYQVKGYPTMLFLNGKGEEAHKRVVGFLTADRLIPIMKEALAPGSRSEDLEWYREPEKAFAAAKELGKPLFVDVFTTWCSWCKKLDKETFSTPSFQAEAARFVLLKVDGDVYRDFVTRYAVKGYPTMLFLNAEGEENHQRVVGYVSAAKLVPIMQEVGAREGYSPAWGTSIEEAYAESKATGKPVFTWASMNNCSWCDKLERETFSTPGFAEIAQKFVLLKVMRHEEPAFMSQYQITGYPTMLFLDDKGQEFYARIRGYVPASTLLPAMQKALDAYSSR